MTTSADVLSRRGLLRRATLLATALAALAAALLAFGAARSAAYEGIFCSPSSLGLGEFCPSNYVTNIRRAIGNSSTGGYTHVETGTTAGGRSGACGVPNCTADTGYLSKDGNGYGYIEDIRSGRYTFHGYLYP
jgi:hypothetical protein